MICINRYMIWVDWYYLKYILFMFYILMKMVINVLNKVIYLLLFWGNFFVLFWIWFKIFLVVIINCVRNID